MAARNLLVFDLLQLSPCRHVAPAPGPVNLYEVLLPDTGHSPDLAQVVLGASVAMVCTRCVQSPMTPCPDTGSGGCGLALQVKGDRGALGCLLVLVSVILLIDIVTLPSSPYVVCTYIPDDDFKMLGVGCPAERSLLLYGTTVFCDPGAPSTSALQPDDLRPR
ncbi:hypothetical protein PG997_003624 [Apiospora hydei]|uniref:Uncharacterized protein n=1 Tax=Apiospora hydei TaxID=1337664 RepID=A0ABR1WZQ6_9PEZI